jgi:hypothetical protein
MSWFAKALQRFNCFRHQVTIRNLTCCGNYMDQLSATEGETKCIRVTLDSRAVRPAQHGVKMPHNRVNNPKLKGKGKVHAEQATKAHRWSKRIAILFL